VAISCARQVAQQYAGEVRTRFGDRVRGIWLYGSAARGDWCEESDIDVLVLLDVVSDADSDWLVKRAYRLGLMEKGLLLQPVMLTAAQFDRLVSRERRFALDVLREGVTL
jgi:predicted nucleotidyltransferase